LSPSGDLGFEDLEVDEKEVVREENACGLRGVVV
jgi:hypothetical protein